MKMADFIYETLLQNPGSNIYWDGAKFIMIVRRGSGKLIFNLPGKVLRHDETLDAVYYTDEKNMRRYLVYLYRI